MYGNCIVCIWESFHGENLLKTFGDWYYLFFFYIDWRFLRTHIGCSDSLKSDKTMEPNLS